MATTPDQPSSDASSFPRGPLPPGEEHTQSADALLFRRYRVLKELGRGGMGVVLLAHDTALEIPVAVKLVPDLVVKDTEAIADLRKEVLRGMALNHDGIVRTHNFEKDETGAGIVMEFVEGDTLTDLKVAQPGGCFDPEQILPWLTQLCAVLDYAHAERRIVHRDLKPRNIMLTKTGRIKVADFGIAAMISDSMSRHSMEGTVSGTLSYMSPQQAQGLKPSPLDDIHAIGATIYELLTGKPPFFRGAPASIHAQILSVVPPSLTERREELEVIGKAPLPPVWEEVIAACLAKDPTQRPQSAGEVLARLRTLPLEEAIPAPAPASLPAVAIAEDTPTVADPTPAAAPRRARAIQRSPAKKWARQWLAWAAVVCVLVLAVATPTLLSLRRPAVLASASVPQSTPALAPASAPVPPTVEPLIAAASPAPAMASKPKPMPTQRPEPVPDTRYGELVMQAKQLRERGDLVSALTRLREAAAIDPKNPEATAEVAITYEKMQLPDKAAEQWKRIYDMGDSAGVYYTLAKARAENAPVVVQAAARAPSSPPPTAATPAPSTPAPKSQPAVTPGAATKDKPFINSLGQEFVPIPGTQVLFCRWETRVKDYRQFVDGAQYDMAKGESAFTAGRDTRGTVIWEFAGGTWLDPKFPQPQGADHPVVCVSWEDAKAFCDWLTRTERASGRLRAPAVYRLPTDREWSVAIGLGAMESPTLEPGDSSKKVAGAYPWGTQWPPPPGAGNFAGEESRVQVGTAEGWTYIADYDDGAPRTAPVGSCPASPLGLYDLSGNVWEWCEDRIHRADERRVLRGGSWYDDDYEKLRSSYRRQDLPTRRWDRYGFRIVLDPGSTSTPPLKPKAVLPEHLRWMPGSYNITQNTNKPGLVYTGSLEVTLNPDGKSFRFVGAAQVSGTKTDSNNITGNISFDDTVPVWQMTAKGSSSVEFILRGTAFHGDRKLSPTTLHQDSTALKCTTYGSLKDILIFGARSDSYNFHKAP